MSKLKLLFSAFNRGHAFFAGSTALSLLFPLISAPIVARLYTPSDFGVYTIYFAVATILTVVSSLCMQNAITLEDTEIGRYHALVLSGGLTALFAVVLAGILFLTPNAVLGMIFGELSLPLLKWLPITVLLGGVLTALYAWATKNQEYKVLGRNKIILSGATMLLQIGIGLTGPGPLGFVAANLIGLLIACLLLLKMFVDSPNRQKLFFTWQGVGQKFNKYYALALWTLPATLVNSVSNYLPDLLIGRTFGTTQLGHYSFACRMVSMPLSFITTSAQEFFRQQASDEFSKNGNCNQSFTRFFWLLLFVSILIIVPMLLMLPYVFPILFGSQWGPAGSLMQAISFLLITRFISSPLSYMWIICGKQRLDFFWQVGLVILSVSTLAAPSILDESISLVEVLFYYSSFVGAWYLLCLLVSWKYSAGKH